VYKYIYIRNGFVILLTKMFGVIFFFKVITVVFTPRCMHQIKTKILGPKQSLHTEAQTDRQKRVSQVSA